MVKHQNESPDNIRIRNRQRGTRKVWASPEWKKKKAEGLERNPVCCHCRNPSQVPHHPDLEVYGRPEYISLKDTIWLCNRCHRGIHKRKFKCPVCGAIASTSEGETCYSCLDNGNRDTLKFNREHWNRVRNKINRKKYREYKEGKKK